MSSSLVNSLAKVYDPNPLHGQKPAGRKLSLNGSDKSQASSSPSSSSFPHDAALRCVESRMDSLSSQMEHLLNMQQTVLTRLDGLSQDVRCMGRDLASMREEGRGGRRGSGVEVCRELRGAVERTSERMESQGRRLEGVEKLVEGTQQVISFIGEVVKSSRLVELLFKQPGNKKAKDDKDKAKLSLKGLKAQKKRKPLDTSDTSSLNEPVLQEQVEKLNRQNTEHSHGKAEADNQTIRGEDRGSGGRRQEPAELILDGPHTSAAQSEERKKATNEKDEEEEDVFEDSESEEGEEKADDFSPEQAGKVEDDGKKKHKGEAESVIADICKTSLQPQESSEEVGDVATCSKRRVTEEDLVKDDLKKSRVEDSKVENADGQLVEGGEPQASKSDEVKTEAEEEGKEGESAGKEFTIDSSPPPLAPFDHRIVTPKPHQIATYYTINRDEVLGGGRFGQVHKCMENSSGLMLAAKIIKARSQKEKDVVRNEIQVMNQLNHANLIQLYAAFESRHDIILVMEYVEGGELFDRIIDENYNLTELDTVLFIRQICEGLQYMHKMYILHLDLKPENILCVSRATNKIKIIDFGLARRYKPREKLRVNFGTPEFLAPEVINYEFVSFPTDMWSLGVITYMLLSGLSPFLGDDDNETLNNILACQWNFEEEEFTDISDEAKDFITRLLVKSKSWRMSAAESLRHPWLSDQSLHYRLNLKKNKCHSTHAPSPESQTETL
ncbi:myosin light chain kinase 2, skeletal/cardiac muscle [Enoplosus armatus]|uniref:myosin light chain kinase 2, skeletal/cardiac muscle n=1 Tax=Enoplosus armatus TaxID=215367 RepID=UPI0039941F9A